MEKIYRYKIIGMEVKIMVKSARNRFKTDKRHRFFMISGEEGLGKTNAALERAVFLKDNYCIRSNENILYISEEDLNQSLDYVKSENTRDNTLFSCLDNHIEIMSKKELFRRCFSLLKDERRFCENDIIRGILLNGIAELRKEKIGVDKIIMPHNIDFLQEEIIYMKTLGIGTVDEYLHLNRKNRGRSLRKNSRQRNAIYRLYSWYVNYMKKYNLIDYVDEFNAISNVDFRKAGMDFAHIIIDNCELCTIKEMRFIRTLLKNLDYSNFIVIKNTKIKPERPWNDYFKRNKDILLIDDNKYKSIRFRSVRPEKEVIAKEEKMQISHNYIEKFIYVDFKHNVNHEFAVDTSSYDEVILNPDTTSEIINKDELNSIPVYNEIAAGQPITINDEIEGNFNVPVYWLKGVDQPFILKIKGDSMINIDIQDGDYVIINKQTMANHNDIVAVSIDGEATLKRLWLKGGKAVLMPENDKYSPIEIFEDNAYIIGKAVGLIKAVS